MKKKATNQHFPDLTYDQLINTSGGNSNLLNVINDILRKLKRTK